MGPGLRTLLLAGLVAGLLDLSCAARVCPTGWSRFRTNCYRMFGDRVTWSDAKFVCVLHQSQLASVHDSDENDFIYAMFSSTNDLSWSEHKGYWMGLNDIQQEGTFVWSDGSAADFTDWSLTNPSNQGGNEDCVHMWYNWHKDRTHTDYTWNDLNCAETARYVCKKEAP